MKESDWARMHVDEAVRALWIALRHLSEYEIKEPDQGIMLPDDFDAFSVVTRHRAVQSRLAGLAGKTK